MTANSMNYHLSNGVKQFGNGDTVHWRIEITRGIEDNVDYWFVAYWINGRGYHYTLFAGYGARHHIRYARGIDNAVISAKTHIDNRIDKIHPPSVWVCPKPAPIPSAIIPYGSLYTPVTLAPVQPVISADENPRKELDGELVTLQRIEYAPMGNKVAWWGYADSYGVTVRFRIYPEHAALFPEAGQERLPHADKDIPNISVVLAWNEHHNDLRIDSVYGSDEKHFASLSKPKLLPVAMPTEDTRTEIQKKLGMNSPYTRGMDFRLNKTKAS